MLASGPSSAATPSAPAVGTYARREPETTVLHRVMREHLETFLLTVLAIVRKRLKLIALANLAHLGLPTFAPPLARARSPAFDFA